MSSNTKITYINKSMNNDLPSIFVFTKNETPTFDCLREGVAWRVIPDVGQIPFNKREIIERDLTKPLNGT